MFKQIMNKIANLFKWLVKSLLIGVLIIFVFNFVGSYINLNIPVIIFTILIIGALRIPGVAAILIYNLI